MVETIGVEPMTSCMSSMRSNQLSYASGTAEKAEFLSTTYILYHIRRKNAIGFLIFSAGFPDFFFADGSWLPEIRADFPSGQGGASTPEAVRRGQRRSESARGDRKVPEAIGKCRRRCGCQWQCESAGGGAQTPDVVRRRRWQCGGDGLLKKSVPLRSFFRCRGRYSSFRQRSA